MKLETTIVPLVLGLAIVGCGAEKTEPKTVDNVVAKRFEQQHQQLIEVQRKHQETLNELRKMREQLNDSNRQLQVKQETIETLRQQISDQLPIPN